MSAGSPETADPLADMRAKIAQNKAELDARNARVTEIRALFGIGQEDAATLERQFRAYPDQRRAKDLINHCALTLRARRRFMTGHGETSKRRARA